MNRIRNPTRALIASALIISLTACSSKDDDDKNITPGVIPYPDPTAPSEFPTKIDTEEGTTGNDTPTTATAVSVGETTYHTIYPAGEADWLSLPLTGGTSYEFSVDNVSYNGIPKLELYASSNTSTPVAQDWGYISFNPRIRYTPTSNGTYYLKVSDQAGGVSSYTLSSRVFSDSDSDTYSPHYDCDDTDPTIFPWALEIAADGVDQSCSGYDWPDAAATDSFEPDNTFNSAGSLPLLKGDPWDIIHRGEVYAQTHTIHTTDKDFFRITVPANSAHEIMEVETTGTTLDSTVYLADKTTVYDFTVNGQFITHWLDNSDSNTASDFYLKINASDNISTAAYVLGLSDGGSDADGDGFFTRSQGFGWDCDDSDATIYTGAVELSPNDGIDSNCNGKDDS